MARKSLDIHVQPIYEAVQTWKERCLLGSGSMLSSRKRLWTRKMLNEIDPNLFAKDKGSGTKGFYERLHIQISDLSANHKKLISELMWLLLLFTTKVNIDRKRNRIYKIWIQPEGEMNEHLDFLGDSVLAGVGNAGTAFSRYLQLELVFLVKAMQNFKGKNVNSRKEIANDPWRFSNWIDNVSAGENRTIIHILPHLLFPDSFERIASDHMKRKVLQEFEGASNSEVGKMNVTEVNRALLILRKDLEVKHGEFDFFDKEFVAQWESKQQKLPMHEPVPSEPAKKVKEDSDPPPSVIERPLNLILYGPPGTGKTMALTKRYMPRYRNGRQCRFKFITFHQSYAYEDFVEGIRPKAKGGDLSYKVRRGPLRRICDQARKAPNKRFALFIDEINRGNVAKIFGELITLTEADKRIRTDASGKRLPSCKGIEVTLPYSGDTFGVPINVDIIGTMNTADRSIALIDSALRRRFDFEELIPRPQILPSIDAGDGKQINLHRLLETINSRLTYLLHRDQTLGHSYFIHVESFEDLRLVFAKKILPFLQEAFYDDWQRIRLILADHTVEREHQLVRERAVDASDLFHGIDTSEIGSSSVFELVPVDEISPDAIRKIYEPPE